jgi:hypothetical protein
MATQLDSNYRGGPMRTILSSHSDIQLQPDEVDVLAKAFDRALTALGADGETAAARELVSEFIITAASSGERDVERLADAAVQAFHSRVAAAQLATPSEAQPR